MNVVQPASSALRTLIRKDLQQDIDAAVTAIEHLAIRAAHSREPCATILFRTAELLRIAVVTR
ncbi:hypothetical protein [Roseomonas marmotae]|uniref:Uncharacterized protein n=1 Tax=Roseomonas marmotae TaxID=2768161 RepID=A0ABS3KI52_9PROT|nr:hypothetical protein [Roseomonas marmotae]MBO1077137.1 hypothetical protein [Roseomonas marmotae]QTI82133.1 hypothetical protein IAI58_22540 [Roseomonas marmotae]